MEDSLKKQIPKMKPFIACVEEHIIGTGMSHFAFDVCDFI